MSTHDTCALLALCRALFEVTVTNAELIQDEDETKVSNLVSENGKEHPVAMAKGIGAGRGGGFGGKSSFGRGGGIGSAGRGGYSSFGKMSVPAGRATGSVNRVGYGSHYNRGGGSFIPIFLLMGAGRGYGRGRHTCTLQRDNGEHDNSSDWAGAILLIGLGIMLILIFRCVLKRQRTTGGIL